MSAVRIFISKPTGFKINFRYRIGYPILNWVADFYYLCAHNSRDYGKYKSSEYVCDNIRGDSGQCVGNNAYSGWSSADLAGVFCYL